MNPGGAHWLGHLLSADRRVQGIQRQPSVGFRRHGVQHEPYHRNVAGFEIVEIGAIADDHLVAAGQCASNAVMYPGIIYPANASSRFVGRIEKLTPFGVLSAKPASEIRMPAIMDFNLLPNMGRMSTRLRSTARTRSSLARTAVPNTGWSLRR